MIVFIRSALLVVGFLLIVMLWIVTGKSPFVWLTWAGIYGEALRRQVLASLRVALQHAVANFQGSVEAVKNDLQERTCTCCAKPLSVCTKELAAIYDRNHEEMA